MTELAELAAASAAGIDWKDWAEYAETHPAMAAEARRIGSRVLAALADAGRLRSDEDQQAEARVRTQVAREIADEISKMSRLLGSPEAAIVQVAEKCAEIARRHSGTGADT